MNWIDIKERQPAHQQTILAKTLHGYCVVIFIDSVKMNDALDKTKYESEKVDAIKHPYYFCSQERQGYTIPGVTHWIELDVLPTADIIAFKKNG